MNLIVNRLMYMVYIVSENLESYEILPTTSVTSRADNGSQLHLSPQENSNPTETEVLKGQVRTDDVNLSINLGSHVLASSLSSALKGQDSPVNKKKVRYFPLHNPFVSIHVFIY